MKQLNNPGPLKHSRQAASLRRYKPARGKAVSRRSEWMNNDFRPERTAYERIPVDSQHAIVPFPAAN